MVSIPSGLLTCLRELLAFENGLPSMARLLVLAFCLLAAALPASVPREPPVILVIGDSA